MTPPLFILAPGRSFTSISCGMIGCHPQLFGVAEINLFAAETVGELAKLYRRHTIAGRRLDQGLLRTMAELAFGEQTEESVEAVNAWLAENGAMRTDELFREMQDWAGGRGLVDKSPFNVHNPTALPRIAKYIPEARFLHLTRHPGDTVQSGYQMRRTFTDKTKEKFPGLGPLIENHLDSILPRSAFRATEGPFDDVPDQAWLAPHRSILKFLDGIPPERRMRMRGEDLLSEPRKRLAEIAQWLGVGTSEADIEAMMHPETSPFAKYGPKNAKFGNDPNFIDHPKLRPYSFKPHPLEWTAPDGKVIPMGAQVCALAKEFGY